MTGLSLEDMLSSVSLNDIERELQTRSMHEFIKGAWTQLEPGRKFHDNWHIQSICEHLEAVVNNDIRRLIINIPPRHMKSLLCSVAFPTWAWIHKPHLQFLFASYARSLSTRDSVKCRRLIQSPWYQQKWGNIFKITTDQNQKQRFENSCNGHRISTSVDSGITGDGGDIIVIDDPHNVKEAESEAVREATLEWWDTAVQTRVNDPETGAFVIIMQRVHENDLTGHILKNSNADWTHLCVPAEYELDHPHKFYTSLSTAKVKEDPRIEEGELLWPSRFTEKSIGELKTSLGTYGAAGQLQQRPAPKGGGILRSGWWKKWENESFPEFIYVLQSWDTAFSEADNLKSAYSACTTWGVFPRGGHYNIMIMNRWRKRVSYPELRKEARTLYDDFMPDAVLIEKKASGHSLIQDMKQMGIPCIPYSPDRDKVARAHAASPMIESGIVWYPDRKWAQEVIDWCAMFPAGDGADIVDTVTQALLRLRFMWYAEPHGDGDWEPQETEREDPLQDNVVINFPRPVYG